MHFIEGKKKEKFIDIKVHTHRRIGEQNKTKNEEADDKGKLTLQNETSVVFIEESKNQ